MTFTLDSDKIRVTGRTLFVDGVRYLGYSGSSVSFTFSGKRASACICSDVGQWEENLLAWIAVYVNDEEQPAKRICLNRKEAEYILYEAQTASPVTLTITKYSEAPFALCGLSRIDIDSDTLLPPPPERSRRIEVIGDSITCGYGIEADSCTQPFTTAQENPASAYALQTARRLNAEVNLVSWSGNGIISHYVDASAEAPSDQLLMPEVYRYTDISASQRLFPETPEAWEIWDPGRFQPQIILVNLGTNDCSWCKDIPERRQEFCSRYSEFLQQIRSRNPKAQILCMLGTMDQRLQKEAELAAMSAGENVHFLPLQLHREEDGYGADWHPSAYTHTLTADILTAEIAAIMNWQ